MSMRPPVDRVRIGEFLSRLGSTNLPGRLYLAGGSALVYQGVRGGTLDIDIALESDDEVRLLEVIRRLKDELQVNVELSSPADFVPLPAGWHDRAQFLRRFGALDVFVFDWYSIALSKLARGSERDLSDTERLVRDGLITLDELMRVVAEVLPQLGAGRYFNIEPSVVQENLAEVRQRLQEKG